MKFNKSHFEDYLSERLPETDRNNFEKSLRNDADLKHSFDFYKNYRAKNGGGTRINGNTVSSSTSSVSSKHFNVLSLIYTVSLLAAIGFLGFSAVYWHAVYNYTNDALQEEFLYEAFDIAQLESGISETNESPIHLQEVVLAQQYFKSRDFDESINVFDKIIATNASQPNLFGEALSQHLLEQAEWNRIVALLLLEQYDDEVNLALNDILLNKEHAFHTQAIALDAKMNSFMRGLVASI